MTPDEQADALRTEIQRVNASVEPITLAELEELVTPIPPGPIEPSAPLMNGVKWSVPVTQGDKMPEPRPSRPLLFTAAFVAAAVLILAGVALGATGQTSDSPGPDNAAVERADEQLPELSAVEIVDRRYEALNRLDFAAAHRDVAADVEYCELAHAGAQSFTGCIDPEVEYHGPSGWAERIEIAALRAHAYGGEIEYSCDETGSDVVCRQRPVHSLLDAAGSEYPLEAVTYRVRDGQIISIEEQSESIGLIRTQVRIQETAYLACLNKEHPDELHSLSIAGQPIASNDTAPRHRQLVSQWLATGN